MNIVEYLLQNKNNLKYKKYSDDRNNVYVTGIGGTAIKYDIIDGEKDQFAKHESPIGFLIAKMLLKSHENEFWNDEIKMKIKKQKEYCEEHNAPNFAPLDGFCWNCHTQIYNELDINRVSNEVITGCPHCHRSYCD